MLRLDALDPDARAFCMARARWRLEQLSPDEFVGRREAILGYAY
jgi:hypothetical protein